MFRKNQFRILCYQAERILARLFKDMKVSGKVGNPECRDAALPRTKKVTRTPQLKVYLGYFEAIIGLNHRCQAAFCHPDLVRSILITNIQLIAPVHES